MIPIQEVFQNVLLTPLFELLKFLTTTTGNFGIAIIILTVIVRTILIPFTLPTLRSQKKMRDIKPQLDELKKKHANDAKALQKAQMELFAAHGINPLGGCLPYIAQFVVLIALYNVLQGFVTKAAQVGLTVPTSFLALDLSKPDHSLVIPILAALTQLVMSIQLLPGAEHHDLVSDKSTKKKVIQANEKETDSQEMAESMQRQMMYMMPIMTGIFAYQFPAGLGIYWITTTLYSIVQQWMISGPGGLVDVARAIRARVQRFV